MKILIAAGGSGGHVFPALSVAQELRKNNHEILFITTRGVAMEKIIQKGFKSAIISARGVSLKTPLAFFIALSCMIKAFIESLTVILCFRPQRVVGFGGYGAFPALFAAALLRYPTLIHEQNVVPGRANHILASIVSKVAISFKESREYFSTHKTVFAGCPCRTKSTHSSNEEIFKKFHFDNSQRTILVLGGSQGSHKINEEFLKTANLLKNEMAF